MGWQPELLPSLPALSHVDLRADNILLGEQPGQVAFVDWAHPGTAAPWADEGLLLADVVTSGSSVESNGDIDVVHTFSRLHHDSDPELAVALVSSLAAYLHDRAQQGADSAAARSRLADSDLRKDVALCRHPHALSDERAVRGFRYGEHRQVFRRSEVGQDLGRFVLPVLVARRSEPRPHGQSSSGDHGQWALLAGGRLEVVEVLSRHVSEHDDIVGMAAASQPQPVQHDVSVGGQIDDLGNDAGGIQ